MKIWSFLCGLWTRAKLMLSLIASVLHARKTGADVSRVVEVLYGAPESLGWESSKPFFTPDDAESRS